MNRTPKIIISKHDLNNFSTGSLKIDPFWNDLIERGDTKKKRVK
jgi:hypothetical protein